ncbi:MAG: anti-sigma factor antagonist [Candidatus Latescibacterota bacterium]|nr:MAG: anti-sigma factor antagonist [Candidatus Latescibacterota bacterium]
MILRSVDFQSKRVTVEITDLKRVGWYWSLCDFIESCKNLSFRHITLLCSEDNWNEIVRLLRSHRNKVTEEMQIMRLEKVTQSWQRRMGRIQFECSPPPVGETGEGARLEYLLRIIGFPFGLSLISKFAVLCGKSVGMSDRKVTNLRLAVYELAINSVEHAVFDCPIPMIEIQLSLGRQDIKVTYRDNARPFPTHQPRHKCVEEKLRNGDRRGWGLLLVRRVVTNLEFERRGEWNCTDFTMSMDEQVCEKRKERQAMEQFSVEIVPTVLEDVVVLKPKGSIDSESAVFLEKHLDSAAAKGKCRVVLDLSATDFVSSCGVGLLLGSSAALRHQGGELILMSVSDAVVQILDIAGIDEYFRMISGLDELRVRAKS